MKSNNTLYRVSKTVATASLPMVNFATTHFGRRHGRRFERVGDYLRSNRAAGYVGWVGRGNIGDEALFEAFEKLFADFTPILYDCQPFELLLHRKFIARKPFFDFVALGGGTLFSYRPYYYQIDHALNHGLPLLTFGTGVNDPSVYPDSPEDPDHTAIVNDWAKLLRGQRSILVRGPRSKAMLERHGLEDVKVIGDPALSICDPAIREAGRRGRVGINLGCEGKMWGTQADLNQSVAVAIRYLLNKGNDVEFIPMNGIDLKIGQSLVQQIRHERFTVFKQYKTATDVLARLADCDFLIGQRLHAVILACGIGVPAIALEYRPKVGDFMESFEQIHFNLRTDHVTSDRLITLIDEIDKAHDAVSRQLIDQGNYYRRIQQCAADRFVKTLGDRLATQDTQPAYSPSSK